MVGIVLVSHSSQLASGLAELIAQVAGAKVKVEAAGGGPDGSLGTSSDAIPLTLARANWGQGVVVLADLGSAVLTVKHLLENDSDQIRLVDAPFAEGAAAAAVTATGGRAFGGGGQGSRGSTACP
ncbi:MAG TPA: dihydroxyacetone kinase phosphoryl donor subunit DhaM [Candidatus Dormibacteraeota bacterium]|jgi:PTS hybrid protein|nr:dihydroxyacetone kinase phosphoryl donor subunit DhaM [Candidatus Dormibacteraeota bacterium]